MTVPGAPLRLRIPNLVLVLARELLGYTQQELADRLTEEAARQGDYQTICDVRMVRRWENGDIVWPQERYRVLLERVFGRPVSELGFVRRWTRTSSGWVLVASAAIESQAKEDVGDPVLRRDLFDLSLGFGVLLGEPEEKWFHSEVEYAAKGERPRRIGMRHVERIERLAEQINSLDQSHGGRALLPHALNGVRAGRILLKKSEYAEEVGERLESATGQLLVQAGWVAYDSGRQQLARHLYAEAFVLGTVSGHDEATVRALANMSSQAKALGYFKDAVKFAEVAQRHTGSWATPRVRTALALRQAGGLARLGEGSACEAALAAATSYFDAGPRDDDPHWIGHLNEEEFANHAGTCLMNLGRVTEADGLLEKAAGNLEHFARNRSASTINYMRNLLLRREVDQACAIGIRVLPVIFGLSSPRIVNQLHKFCEGLREYPSTRAAHEFLDSVSTHVASKRQ